METAIKLEAYAHQQKVINAICKNPFLDKTHILAFCTGGGKTRTAQTIIEYATKSGLRCLVLAHNQKVLRSNFSKDFVDDESVIEYKGREDLDKAKNAMVVIGIPASIKRVIKQLGKFDYLVIDEAHQYVGKDQKMFNEIKQWTGNLPMLLLTATHYNFIGDEYEKHYYPRELALKEGVISDVNVSLIKTDWHPKKDDYDKDGNLKISANIPRVYAEEVYEEIELEIEQEDGYLKKSLIVCHNIKSAKNAYKYFSKAFPGKVLISDSESDKDSKNFTEFQTNDENAKILIIVNRGILGFDCRSLECLFDITLSKNIARIEQLFGRILRVKPGFDLEKFYFRIAPSTDITNHTIIMNSILALSIESNNQLFDGSKTSLKIIFKPEEKERLLAEEAEAKERLKHAPPPKKQPKNKSRVNDKKKEKKVRDILKQSEYINDFYEIKERGCEVWELENFTTLGDALGVNSHVDWTEELIIELIIKNSQWKCFRHMAKDYSGALRYLYMNRDVKDKIADKFGWTFVETKEKRKKGSITYEEVVDYCKSNNLRKPSEFTKKCGSLADYISRNGLWSKLKEDMNWKSDNRGGDRKSK